jgi:hypothetical protein
MVGPDDGVFIWIGWQYVSLATFEVFWTERAVGSVLFIYRRMHTCLKTHLNDPFLSKLLINQCSGLPKIG